MVLLGGECYIIFCPTVGTISWLASNSDLFNMFERNNIQTSLTTELSDCYVCNVTNVLTVVFVSEFAIK